jgi:hypothetical protein
MGAGRQPLRRARGDLVRLGLESEDFVLAPHNHARAKVVMLRDIEIVRRLWRGESAALPRPRRRQRRRAHACRGRAARAAGLDHLAAGNLETFVAAGSMGANLLTHLLGQSVEQLAPKIRAYRALAPGRLRSRRGRGRVDAPHLRRRRRGAHARAGASAAGALPGELARPVETARLVLPGLPPPER